MNFPSVSQFSIAKGTGGNKPPEMYIPLWWYSGAVAGSGNTTYSSFLSRGSTGMNTLNTSSQSQLHTLNTNWSNAKYAFEASITIGSGGGSTVYAQLYDMTTKTVVSGSQISTTATSLTVIRSSQFTLTSGHVYGVSLYTSNGSYSAQLTDASLIIFPS